MLDVALSLDRIYALVDTHARIAKRQCIGQQYDADQHSSQQHACPSGSISAFGHGIIHTLPNNLTLYDSYHCSRYNTQTKRLNVRMFEQVFEKICANLALHIKTKG